MTHKGNNFSVHIRESLERQGVKINHVPTPPLSSCDVREIRLHFIPPYFSEDRYAEKRGFRLAPPPSAAQNPDGFCSVYFCK
jgi:hypothetical protein